jgi:hypothetical protein
MSAPEAAEREVLTLSVIRLAGLTAAIASFSAWTAYAGHLPNVGLWPDVLILALVVFPLTFSVVWLALPLYEARGLLPATVAFALLAWGLYAAEWMVLFNTAKLLSYALAGLWFMGLLQVLWSFVVIAAIIPIVDAISVWRGPTRVVVERKPEVFDWISIAFRLPGEAGTANIGPPDIFFFALFLAAAAKCGLRVVWTFVAMVALLGVTIAVTAATNEGLPALPAIAIGFLAANPDRLWRELRSARGHRTQLSRRGGRDPS